MAYMAPHGSLGTVCDCVSAMEAHGRGAMHFKQGRRAMQLATRHMVSHAVKFVCRVQLPVLLKEEKTDKMVADHRDERCRRCGQPSPLHTIHIMKPSGSDVLDGQRRGAPVSWCGGTVIRARGGWQSKLATQPLICLL